MSAARMFGAREDVRQVSLSPDGKRIAMLRSTRGAGRQVDYVEGEGLTRQLDDAGVRTKMPGKALGVAG